MNKLKFLRNEDWGKFRLWLNGVEIEGVLDCGLERGCGLPTATIKIVVDDWEDVVETATKNVADAVDFFKGRAIGPEGTVIYYYKTGGYFGAFPNFCQPFGMEEWQRVCTSAEYNAEVKRRKHRAAMEGLFPKTTEDTKAEITRKHYLAYVEQGFTPEQAIELCKGAIK